MWRRITSAVCVVLLAATLVSCGGGAFSFTGGNWSLQGTSSTSPGFNLGGNLTQNGSQLTGALCYNTLVQCNGGTLQFSGTVIGKSTVLTATAPDGSVVTLHLNGSSPTAASGSYQIEQNSTTIDQGSVSGSFVPSLTGTWTGSSGGSNGITFSGVFTQGQPTADGSFQLSLTSVSATGGSCSITGGSGTGTIAGNILNVTQGFVLGAKITDPATATSMNASLSCDFLDTIMLTKQ